MKEKRRLHWIDICVVVLAIVLIGGAYYKFNVLDKTSKTENYEKITYTVEIKKVRDYVNNNIQIGDTLFDKTSGNPIGTIINMELTQAREAVSLVDGTYKEGDVENRVDVILTVEVNGIRTDNGVFANKTYEILSGSERKFMTKYFECQGFIRDIL